MSRYVHEIMNDELVFTRPHTPVGEALHQLLSFRLHSMPVLDDARRATGMASLSDLVDVEPLTPVSERMSAPAVTMPRNALISRAAAIFGSTGHHRMPVVDDRAQVVGIISAIDVVRALSGLPISHPGVFPHLEKITGRVWSDEVTLDLDRVDLAPDGPGLFMLVQGMVGEPDRIVWAEGPSNVRTRLSDLLSTPQLSPLSQLLTEPGLRVRAAAVPDPALRNRALRRLWDHIWPPHRRAA